MEAVNQSVIKALDVLDLLGRMNEGARLQDIASTLGYPESTVHRLLASLATKGYVRQSHHTTTYHLGWKIVTLARTMENVNRLSQELRPYAQTLLRQVQHAVNVAVLNGTHVLYVDCLAPDTGFSVHSPPGLLMPIHATSLGRCLLAKLPDAEREDLLSQLKLEAFTPNTITSFETLKKSIAEVSRLGYAIDNEEYKAGVQCIAVPIVLPEINMTVGISITARTLDLPANGIEHFAPLMLALSSQITDEFKWQEPDAARQ